MRLIIDVMSGDAAPIEAVRGAYKALRELNVDITLTGREEDILKSISEIGENSEDVKIVNADSVVTMNDDYLVVIKSKKNSSMSVGLTLLRDGEGDAFISTGNTGALVAGSSLILRRIKGVKSACIATLLPLGTPKLLIDSGANVEPDSKTMYQSAVMGEIYIKKMLGIEKPRVALLNNGTEPTKGRALIRDTYDLLSKSEDVNFIGNIEGRDIVEDSCDVIVADGYTGNIILKAAEGFGKFMSSTLKSILFKNARTKIGALFISKEAKNLKKSMDYTEYGGAPLLGVSRPVIKAHGNSGEKALFSACRQAVTIAETGIIEEIAEKAQMWRKNVRETEN